MTKAQAKTNTVQKRPKHRKLLWFLLVPAVLIGLYVAFIGVAVFRAAFSTIDNFDNVSFDNELPVPQLAKSHAVNGVRTFELNLQEGATEFFDGKQTKTWGVNGSYLGPTLRARRGEKVQVHVKNSLPETTSIHWHGMHLPAEMDGGPHQPIEKGETWSPHWQIDQPAATLWYHPHPHGRTEKHVYRGIAGMIILDDDNPVAEKLPHDYGKDDIPVIVQDKRFTSDKQLDEGTVVMSSTGNIGNEILVNGVRTPFFDVTTERVRLRLLNGSTARMYNFGFSDDREMQVVASDGGLLEKPVTMKRLTLSPGERAEVVVAMKPGERVNLRSYPSDMLGGSLQNRMIGSNDKLEILQLRAGEKLARSPETPEKLVSIAPLTESDAKTTRAFELTGTLINGKSMDMNRIDFSTGAADTEIWEITNRDGGPHNFHIHGVSFQVLEYEGKLPPPELQGWKDTVLMRTGQTARLIVKTPKHTDSRFPFMFHCHLLRHEDQGMMGQFLVTEPGQTPVQSLQGGHAH